MEDPGIYYEKSSPWRLEKKLTHESIYIYIYIYIQTILVLSNDGTVYRGKSLKFFTRA
jgi:hypothetical protein